MKPTYGVMTPELNEAYRARERALASAARGARWAEIDRIMGRYELESDEGGTAEEKAIRIYNSERAKP